MTGDTGFGKMVNAKMLTVDHPAVISAFDSVLSSFSEVCEDMVIWSNREVEAQADD